MSSIEQPCGCKITWHSVEIEPGRWTVLDEMFECSRHLNERMEKIEFERFSEDGNS